MENNVLASWKVQGLLLRIALAIESCSDDDVVAGGFQVDVHLLLAISGFWLIFLLPRFVAVDHLFVFVQVERAFFNGRQQRSATRSHLF